MNKSPLPFKWLAAFLWLACPAALAQGMPFELDAQTISYDISGSRVVARGDATRQVHVTGEQGEVLADTLVYNLNAQTLVAEGNVKFTDIDGNVLLVERMELTGDLKSGAMDQMRLRVPVVGEVAKASTATVSGTTYVLTDVVYSPCKECPGKERPWEISADRMEYDQAEGEVTYRGATMDVYGVPVMYLPWFKHPLGPRKPKNGLLPPQFGKSTTLGDQVTVGGYVFSPAENADYTIKSRLMSARGAQFQLERRQMGIDSQSEIRGSFLNDIGVGRIRNHLSVVAQKDLTATRRIGINGEITNDDTYLNQFFNRSDPYLASTVFGEDAGDRHYAALSMTRFQDLDITRDPAETAQVLPHLQLNRWFAFQHGGQLDLSADVTGIHRSQGNRTQRLVVGGEYTKPWIMADGSKVTAGATLRADGYNIDGVTPYNDGLVSRFLPEGTLTWEKPYISADGYHTIAPTVMAAMSPRGGNLNGKVPNEDSVSYELDTGNLFEPSRFAGLDRVETGPRLVYGLDNRWGDAYSTDWRLFVGQSLRKFDDATLPPSGGASTRDSDWVGLVEASPVDWFTFNNRFRLDNATFIARRLDTGMRIGYVDEEKPYLQMTHSFLDGGPEELNAELHIPLMEDLAFNARTQNDLDNNRLLLGEAALQWVRDCYQLEFLVRRRGYTNGDVQPSTDYILNVQLLSLGDNQ